VIRSSMLRAAFVTAVVVASGVPASRASASGFQLIEKNASGMGNAYAGQAAAAEDASTIFFNPAGMTRLPRLQLVASGALIRPFAEFHDDGSTPPLLQPTLGGEGGDPGSLAVLPNGYVSFETIPGMIWTGVGVTVPFGLATEWDSDWLGRFHGIKSDVLTIDVNPSVAWKIVPWLSVGAGASWQYLDAELSNSVNYSAAAFAVGGAAALGALAAGGCGTAAGGCEGVATVNGDSSGWGWNVGALAELQTKTRVGLTYRSRITHDVEGDITFGNRPALLAPALPNGPAKTTIELPETVSVAVAQELLPALELLADFTWTGWSTIQDLSIFRGNGQPITSTPLNFDDSWRAGLGANYKATEALKVRLGVAYDQTPVKDEFRTPRLPDEDRYWIAGGAQWALTPQVAIDVGAAYLFVDDANIDLPSVDPNPPTGFVTPPRGNLVGIDDGDAWLASAQVRWAF
jgi:long-chain fatty acid transport protein